MANLIMEEGKVYGGMRVIQMIPGVEMITVQCLRCGELVKRNRSNIRTRRIMSCGQFSCKEKSKTFQFTRSK